MKMKTVKNTGSNAPSMNGQTLKPIVIEKNRSEYKTVYYVHPLYVYNADVDVVRNDMELLQSLNLKSLNLDHMHKIINSSKLHLGVDMIPYLKVVKQCDEVWFRGRTADVSLVVLSALALRLPVLSLERKQPISKTEISNLATTFNQSGFYNDNNIHSFLRYKFFSNEQHLIFLSLIEGLFRKLWSLKMQTLLPLKLRTCSWIALKESG